VVATRVLVPAAAAWFLAASIATAPARAQRADNPVDDLNRRLRAGTARLTFDGAGGYLRSVLDALDVPVESQLLVFSPNSLQARLIGPANPRALFFNDAVHVGFVRGGDLLELAVQDAARGVLFYTLAQHATGTPQFKETTICFACHRGRDTLGVPGLLRFNRPVAAAPRLFATGSVPDQRTPFAERWGGWFITGSTGPLRHNGRVDPMFDADGYPSMSSDVAANLVFLHQTHTINLMGRVGWVAGDARSGEAGLRAAAEELVDYMLFVDEAPLPGGVRGSSAFAERFAAAGPRDRRGRSLRELDRERRVMRYPCSYLIYSPAFDGLPAGAQDAVYARLWAVLSGDESRARYAAALPRADRRAVVEILRETKEGLPAYFEPARVR
jgi:hypothetical protein